MTGDQYTPLDEQRTSTRFGREPYSAYAVVRHPELDPIVVEVHEESLGGIGLILRDDSYFAVGQKVEIAYLDCYLKAAVRHVERRQDGTFLVGFGCEPMR